MAGLVGSGWRGRVGWRRVGLRRRSVGSLGLAGSGGSGVPDASGPVKRYGLVAVGSAGSSPHSKVGNA